MYDDDRRDFWGGVFLGSVMVFPVVVFLVGAARSWVPLTVLALVGLCLWLFVAVGSVAVVPPGHRGIKVRLGRIVGDVLPEGLVWKIPFVTKVVLRSVQAVTRQYDWNILSSDLQRVLVSLTIIARIPENQVVRLYREYPGDVMYDLLRPQAAADILALTARRTATEIVTETESLGRDLLAMLRDEMGDGLEIRSVAVTSTALSEGLAQASLKRAVTEQEALAKRHELEKERADAEMLLMRGKAQAESLRMRTASVEGKPDGIKLEAVNKWDGKLPATVVLGGENVPVLLPPGEKSV